MRRSASLIIPMSLILAYYAFWIGLVWFLLGRYPGLSEYVPVGRIGELASSNMETFEPVYTMVDRNLLSPSVPLRLLFAATGSAIMTVPISWVYFITSRARRIDQSLSLIHI